MQYLLQLKPKYKDILTDPVVLSIALDVPTEIEGLIKSINTASPPRQLIFPKNPIQISDQFKQDILNETKKEPAPPNKSFLIPIHELLPSTNKISRCFHICLNNSNILSAYFLFLYII